MVFACVPLQFDFGENGGASKKRLYTEFCISVNEACRVKDVEGASAEKFHEITDFGNFCMRPACHIKDVGRASTEKRKYLVGGTFVWYLTR